MTRKKEILSLGNMTKRTNIVDADYPTTVLEYKTPRGKVALFSKGTAFNLFIPTDQTITHSGSGAESFNLDYGIANSLSLSDAETLKAFVDADGTPIDSANITIDYANDSVEIDHSSNEDLVIFWYSDEGNATIEVERPSGAGKNSRTLFDNSLRKLHTVDQYKSVSPVKLKTSWTLPQKHLFKVKVEAPYEVAWPSEHAQLDRDYLGLIEVDFKLVNINQVSKERLAEANTRYTI